MENKTKKIVFSALLASLTCVATMVIKIPTINGYINLGDGAVLLCGWLLGPVYGFLAAAIGSALADVFYGYMVYAPVTFILKGAVAAVCCLLSKRTKLLISAIAAELIMVAGYYLFEGFLYGFSVALLNVLPNAIQGTAGIIAGLILIKIFKKSNIQS